MRILLSTSAPRRSRQGLSILEVLVASFILLFGLMGVAAMFPVGKLYVSEATRHDMASAVGQAAFNDIQVRGLLYPIAWRSGGSGVPSNSTSTYLVDPLGVEVVGQTGFPYGGTVLTRMTYDNMTSALAQSIFQSRDDLAVTLPDNPDEPAYQIASGPTRDFDGRYSWMFMAQPLQSEVLDEEIFRVSVIVFHSRILDATSSPSFEAAVGVNSIAGGLGGGAVQLSSTTVAELELAKSGQWMMLYGGGQYKWYRIVAADEIDGSTRWVTLQGPDFNGTPAGAVLLDGVAAVYEKVMQRANP